MEQLMEVICAPKTWISLGVAVAALVVTALLQKASRAYLRQSKLEGKRATNAMAGVALIKYGVYLLTLFIILQINGVNIGSLAASLGLVTAAVAFAVQDILKDIIMGTNIMSGEFFAVGDVVKYEDMRGVVQSFNIKTTRLVDIDTGNVYTICNRNISEIQRVSDWTDILVPAGYGEDAQQVRGVCREICAKVEEVHGVKSCEFLGTDAFRDSFVEYRIRIHCPPTQRNRVRRAALGLVQDVFRAHGLTIPFPQLDVHLNEQLP